MSVLSIERIEVGERTVEALVKVADVSQMRTSSVPGLAEKALMLLPGLARHSCTNDDGRSFTAELGNTEAPHLLEHVACELMALAGSPRSLHGDTSWDFARDGRGVFQVRLEYDDDFVALAALREAVSLVDWLYGCAPRPDIDHVVERLKAHREEPPAR